MINRFLFWFTARLPCRLIKLDGRPYLERYFLGQRLGVTCYLHRFVSSDAERHVHNHPWEWGGALVLAGGYIEERALDVCPTAGPSGMLTRMIKRRWFNRVDCNTVHRVHSAEPGTWTLFVHGPRAMVGPVKKGWGFFERMLAPELAAVPEVTIFRQFPEDNSGPWWKTRPVGRDAGREPLQ